MRMKQQQSPLEGAAVGPTGAGEDDRTVVALDVGGTVLKGAVVDANGVPLHELRAPTGTGLPAILDLLARLRAAAPRPAAVGVVVPGIVDDAAGVARYAANLGWRDLPLRALVEEHSGLPVAVSHDVRAGGLAEGMLGAARGVPDFLFLPIGTGIAGAVVIGGRPYAGAHDAAGELGHLVVRPGGPPCACGATGCLEAVASAAAIARHYRQRTGESSASAADVAARVAAGDADAQAVWSDAVAALADGLASYVAVVDPSLIVVGGGLATSGAVLLDPLTEALTARLTVHAPPPVVAAQLGDRAGCMGAALLAWQAAGAPAERLS
jgi:glucokinase